jgi:hypothetical protein
MAVGSDHNGDVARRARVAAAVLESSPAGFIQIRRYCRAFLRKNGPAVHHIRDLTAAARSAPSCVLADCRRPRAAAPQTARQNPACRRPVRRLRDRSEPLQSNVPEFGGALWSRMPAKHGKPVTRMTITRPRRVHPARPWHVT